MKKSESLSGALPSSRIHSLRSVVEIAPEAIVSRTLMRSPGGSVTAFAFDQDQALAEHSAPFDALVHVLEGELVVTIDRAEHELAAGDAIIMPAQIAHSVRAPVAAKWILVMLTKPEDAL
jgi:quercetin dioxygenase-like cupin family protein